MPRRSFITSTKRLARINATVSVNAYLPTFWHWLLWRPRLSSFDYNYIGTSRCIWPEVCLRDWFASFPVVWLYKSQILLRAVFRYGCLGARTCFVAEIQTRSYCPACWIKTSSLCIRHQLRCCSCSVSTNWSGILWQIFVSEMKLLVRFVYLTYEPAVPFPNAQNI